MTNLQILLSVIDIEGEEKEQAILDYFTNQDARQFEIDGCIYVLLDEHEIDDLLYEQYENDFVDFSIHMERFRGYNYSNLVDKYQDDIINDRVKEADYETDLKGYEFVTQVDRQYIFIKDED